MQECGCCRSVFQQSAPTPLSTADIAALTAAAADLPALWHASTTSNAERKQIIRAVVDKITITVWGRSELIDMEIS